MVKYLLITFLLVLNAIASTAQFTAGNLVVSRVGNGTTTLSSAAAQVELVEYSITGVATGVKASLPIINGGVGIRACTNSATATSEGLMTLSSDGRYLVQVGYDAPVGSTSIPQTININRVVARIDKNGLVNTSTSFNSSTGGAYIGNGSTNSNIRSAVTDTGTNFWASGTGTSNSGGVRYITFGQDDVAGTQLNGTIINTRNILISNNQLYVGAAANSITLASVGTGLPTFATAITNLPGIPTSNIGTYGTIFFDRDPLIAGDDLLYISAQNNTVAQTGIFKYSYDGTNWNAQGSINTNAFTQSITGFIGCTGDVQLFITKATSGTLVPNEIVKLVDAAAYNQPITGNGGNFTSLSTSVAVAGTNYAFRGITFTPANSEANITSAINLTGTYNNIVVKSGGVATLTSDISIARSLIIENGGKLNCNGFTILGINGGSFELQAGGTLAITSAVGISSSGSTGNVQTCNRTFSNAANYEYNGTTNQVTGSGLPATINSLILNQPITKYVELTNSVTIASTINLKKGKLVTTNSKLVTLIQTPSAAPIVNTIDNMYSNLWNLPSTRPNYGLDSSYVVGPVKIDASFSNVYACFPVGDSTIFRPVFIENANGLFVATYKKINPYTISINLGAGLDHISSIEYWDITANSSAIGKVELSFYDPNSGGVTNLTDLRVARYTGTQWDNEGNTLTYGVAGANGSVVSSLQTTYGQYTLASSTTLNPLPIKSFKLSVHQNNNTATLNWAILGDEAVKYYELQKSTDKVTVNIINTQQALQQTYTTYYTYNDALTNQYYRVKATLLTGEIAYSNWVSSSKKLNFTCYPNPANNVITIAVNKAATIVISNSIGNAVLQNSILQSTHTIDIRQLPKGIYFVKIIDSNNQIKTGTFIKN